MLPQGGALVRVGEFGPFDLLAERAHRAYQDGFCERSVRACREGLVVADGAGDRETARYLRYIEGVALQELGRHRDALSVALDLVADLDAEVEPAWRAKALALLAEASAGAGEVTRALDALAEGSWLVTRAPADSYGHLSASMAVAIALRAVYLFEHAEPLLAVPRRPQPAQVVLQIVYETAVLHAYWAATLELLGQHEEAGRHLVRCAQSALRMQRVAGELGETEMHARGEVLEAFAVLRLGERGLAVARGTAAGHRFPDRPDLLESQLLHLVLGGDLLGTQQWPRARDHLQVAFDDAQTARREVWAATALYALAECDVGERGRHPAVDTWKLMGRRALQHLWREREARFAALADRNRLRELSEERRRIHAERLADPLTGLGNRRLLRTSVERARGQLSVVFVDVDRFKDVNDLYSHAVGDEVLLGVAAILRQHCRPEDDVIRYGGDEFVVLVHGEGAVSAAEEIARRLHAAVAATDWGAIAPDLSVTVSIGVSRGSLPVDALAAADAALFEAKRAGRNRVVAA